MGRYRFNPFTGTLDLVDTGGGGGGGTVTSVAGGVGITGTPDPIVGAGTLDLDVFSLTTGADPLAAGDWLAFVDVSVGTTPASQRKVTLGDLADAVDALIGPYQPLDAGLTALAGLTPAGLAVTDGADGWLTRLLAVTDSSTVDFTLTNASGVAGNPTITASVIQAGLDHGSIGGLTDDDHSQYVFRNGRPAPNNNFIITDGAAPGRITGSTALSNLELAAGVTFDTDNYVDIIPKLVVGSGLAGEQLPADFALANLGAGVTVNIEDSADCYGVEFTPILNASGDVRSIRHWSARHVVTNDAGETSNMGELRGMLLESTYTPGTGSTMTGLNFRGLVLQPILSNTGTGNSATSIFAVATGAGGSVGASWEVTGDWAIGQIQNPGGTGTIARLGGIRVQDITRGDINYSLWSQGFGVQMRHAGPIVVGDDDLATASVELLDVYGSVAILPSPGAGQLKFYDTDTNYTSIEAQPQAADISWILPAAQGAASTSLTNNGSGVLSWVAHQPLDADLTTIAGLTVAQGSLLLGSAAPAWSTLGIGATDLYLRSNGTTAAWAAVTELGLVDTYNGTAVVSNGVPAVVAQVNATGQTANITPAVTMYTTPAADGFYRLIGEIIVTTVAGVSSTLPGIAITFVNGDNATTQTATPVASNGGNLLTTRGQFLLVFYANASSAITYATNGYASNPATTMQYSLRLRLELI